jgi:hypothetical protein
MAFEVTSLHRIVRTECLLPFEGPRSPQSIQPADAPSQPGASSHFTKIHLIIRTQTHVTADQPPGCS